jgi:hypothetical protein
VSKKKPETLLQQRICDFLRLRKWWVKATHGSVYSWGFPDLYATHSVYGQRWIEVKVPVRYKFTRAQKITFPEMTDHGDKIWILVDATEDEYRKLFAPPNWEAYLR